MSSSGLWEASPTDKNPRSYGQIANKANGSGAVIVDKTVVLRLQERELNVVIVIVNKNWISIILYNAVLRVVQDCSKNVIEWTTNKVVNING